MKDKKKRNRLMNNENRREFLKKGRPKKIGKFKKQPSDERKNYGRGQQVKRKLQSRKLEKKGRKERNNGRRKNTRKGRGMCPLSSYFRPQNIEI